MAEQVSVIAEAMKLLYLVKNCLPSNVEYFKEDNGQISCLTHGGIETWGLGQTYEEARDDLLSSLKEIADMIREDIQNGQDFNFDEVPYMFKILMSSDEELRQWLNYGNI